MARPFHLEGFHLVPSVVTFRTHGGLVASHLCSLLFFLCACLCLCVHSLSTADIVALHPVLTQNVKEFIHPRDFSSSNSPLFIENGNNQIGIPGREGEEGDLTYRNERFDIPAMLAAAEDLLRSSAEGVVSFHAAFNVFVSAFQTYTDDMQTHNRFSQRVNYQCLAIHTPYRDFPNSSKVTEMNHFELVNALFVLSDLDGSTESELRSFAYVEIDEDTGRPVFCGNTRVRSSQVLQQNLVSLNDDLAPVPFNCSTEQKSGRLFSTCTGFPLLGGFSVRTTIPSKWKEIDWSQKAINASQVRTSGLLLTEMSLPTKSASASSCAVACRAAEAATRQQLAEDNPGPINHGTAVGLVLVPAVLGFVLTILEMVLVTSTSVIKNPWGKWIVLGLTVLDLGLTALAIIAAAVELPKFNVPLIYTSWYTAGNSEIEDVTTVSSPIGDLQLEMWMLGEDVNAQWSPIEARNVTIAGLVISCVNAVILVAPALISKLRQYLKREDKNETGGK
ncbi:hypothetical protein FGB62_9g43 [Gracilaria domingensis]|nr:hypothetical protein FGB62_9g43 [Gracilaria domingensis]